MWAVHPVAHQEAENSRLWGLAFECQRSTLIVPGFLSRFCVLKAPMIYQTAAVAVGVWGNECSMSEPRVDIADLKLPCLGVLNLGPIHPRILEAAVTSISTPRNTAPIE